MPERVLEIDRVTKRFGDVLALDAVTFEVRPGELFGFVGSNGAGKTTAMRIVLGVLAADSGAVRFDGRPVTHETRARIGYMPEERGLYPKMKVIDQLVYLARLHGCSADVAHREAQAWITRLGLARRQADTVERLSLGNQQRVQLAAALVHDPDVLVLDEPFSGLDPLAVDVMSDVLREKADTGVPVVFSSHQLDLVERLCDRVGIIRAGRIVASGSVPELTERTAIRISVTVGDEAPDWASAVPGIRVLRTDGATTVVELGPGTEDQTVLRAALAAGPVREFRRHRPSLVELFRNVVTEKTGAENTGTGNAVAGAGTRGAAE